MSERPLYATIEEAIATEIAHGEYRPGDQLPIEDTLLQRFQVSRITVRRAIQNLFSRGLLEIRRGLGTFVLSPQIAAELTKLTGFLEGMSAALVVSQRIVAASARVAERLQSAKGTKVMQIKCRSQLMGGPPFAHLVKRSPFSFRGFDASAFGIGAALLVVVSLASMYLPALRATQVDPVNALRAE
jgi:DNA-binding GntR family transcriptional regulator